MNLNLPLNHQNIDDISELELHEQAGLDMVGLDEDGQPMYRGTKGQWERFIKLSDEHIEETPF